MFSVVGQNFIDLVDSIRFIPRTLVRQRLRKIFGLIFRSIVSQDRRELVRKVLAVLTLIDLCDQDSSSALSPYARIKNSISNGANDRSPFTMAPMRVAGTRKVVRRNDPTPLGDGASYKGFPVRQASLDLATRRRTYR